MPKLKRTKVYITVDTEASIAGCFSDPSRYQPLLDEPVFGYVNGQSEALGFILRTLKESELKATFFTESLQGRYFGNDKMARVAEQIIAHGQDLQLHVHPCWTNFEEGAVVSTVYNDHATGRSVSELVSIFSEAIDRFVQWGFGKPVAVRTGNFSAGLDTFQAFSQLDIKSSSNISIELCPAKEKELHLNLGVHNIHGVLELPLTTYSTFNFQGKAKPRSLTITATSTSEMLSILEQAHAQQLDNICILTHPFEFIKRDDFQFNNMGVHKLNQQRFQALCQFIEKNNDRFETAIFKDLTLNNVKSYPDNIVLRSSYIQSLIRASQNFIYDKTA